MKPFIVCNPAAGGGRTARDWPHIAAALAGAIGPFDHAMTRRQGDAPVLVRQALREGSRLVVAIGGDGTASEAIDGMFEGGPAIPPDASFGLISTGTGRDFRRSFGWSGGIDADIARLAGSDRRTIDLGRLTFDDAGTTKVRHFCNISSFGISGAIVAAVSRAGRARMLGPKGLFLFKTATMLLGYRFQRVRIEIDNHFDETIDIALVAIANGGWFGGGMKVAPEADPADGAFDVVIVRGDTKLQLIGNLHSLYDGSHLGHRAVRVVRGRRIRATPVDEPATGPVLLDADGEAPGRLPASFEILPAALALRG